MKIDTEELEKLVEHHLIKITTGQGGAVTLALGGFINDRHYVFESHEENFEEAVIKIKEQHAELIERLSKLEKNN